MKFLFALAAAVGVAAIAYAAAAGVNVNGGALQQGTDSDLKCTENVSVDFQNVFGLGNADIVITGFDDDACDGARFYLEFLDSGGAVIATCPTDAGSEGSPPGGILITGDEVVLEAPGDCDLVPIATTEQIRVTIVGGGDTD